MKDKEEEEEEKKEVKGVLEKRFRKRINRKRLKRKIK
jgi:hypothetical protein